MFKGSMGTKRRWVAALLLATALGACGRPGTETSGGATTAPASGGEAAAAVTSAPASGQQQATAASAAPASGGEAAGSTGGGTAAAGTAPLDCTTIQSDIKVGMNSSLTGGTADYGQGQLRGFQLALQEYNAKGGYQGTPIACAVYDDATKAETGQENITRLINQDKVVGIVGAANSGVVLGFSQQIQEAGVPFVISVATGTKLTTQFPEQNNIFRVSMPDAHQTATMLEFAKSKGWTKIALFASTSGYGKGGQADVEAAAPQHGVEIVSIQNFEETDTDMTAQVQAARDAGAQAVFTYALAPALSNIFKSLDKVGFSVPVIGSWALSQPQLRELASESLLKNFEIYMAQSYTIDQNDLAKTLHQKMLEAYNEDPFPIAAGQTYDAARLFLMALDAAGPDPKKIREALEQIDGFKAATTAPAKPFATDDHEAIDAQDIFVGTLREVDGKLEVVKAQ